MNSEQTEIARRIAALPWFRWMPGMLDGCNVDRVLRVLDDGRIETSYLVDATCGYHHDREHDVCGVGEMMWPDLNDPATIGCLHAQACRRIGVKAITYSVVHTADNREEWWWHTMGEVAVDIGGRIPADILSAFPDDPFTAAVLAAMLHEAP